MRCEQCGSCGAQLRITADEFKAKFKPGDVITGWGHPPIPLTITGIGRDRFFYIRQDSFGRQGKKEFVAAMNGRVWMPYAPKELA